MKVGIIGLGVVGSALQKGFKKLKHEVLIHDIAYDTKIEDILPAEVCYICVPTPSRSNGRCDTSIVENVVNNLCSIGYDGIIAIKSTVEPGTTMKLIQETGNKNICFVPEFLRERCAAADFIENHDLCVVGTDCDKIYNLIKNSHGDFPKKFTRLKIKEAELVKYFNNIYNATLITLANNFYEVCKALDIDYFEVKNSLVKRKHIQDVYLDCNDSLRGFGGMCLPKDTKAIAYLCKKMQIEAAMFDFLINENSKYPITVFNGMRE